MIYNRELLQPKLCKVCQVEDEYIYPIFKNASSSIFEMSKKVYVNKQISSIGCITVYIRNAESRFNSGVTTYLEHNKDLDKNTLITLIERQELMNSHFMPQYFWLHNLSKHYKGNLYIKDFNDINFTIDRNYTLIKENVKITQDWINIDNAILKGFKNIITTFEDINHYLKIKHGTLYKKCIVQD